MTTLEKWRQEEKEMLTPIISDLFDIDRFFGRNLFRSGLTSNVPVANIFEDEKDFQIELAAPGFTKSDFNVRVDNELLTISAEKEAEEKEENKRYTRREYNYNSFSRSFRLPESVKTEDVRATYENGILRIVLNKKPESIKKQAKEIRIS